MAVRKNTIFRAWYYFRMGWSTYFSFLFAAINTLTVTFYLAIERYPPLSAIFPNFIQYVLIVTIIGIPILVVIGYSHFKITGAQRTEATVNYESNPFARRNLVNSEITLVLNLKLTEMLLKLSNNEKLTEEELAEITKLQKKYVEYSKDRKILSKKDLDFLKNMYE